MEKYEQLRTVGEGSYGVVIKCRHRETDQVVAIKKFVETEEDATVRRMALREIRMLKKLKHENLVAMIEVFRHRKRFYLVFEYVERTVLDELEKMTSGLGEDRCRERIYQVLRAINFCHSNHVIHRDVKPENVLVSSSGVVKLCDFGFARLMSLNGEPCTDYVATRWYRAPELLVGEPIYGPAVDIWAVGCLFAEMMTGNALFAGESDIDQLFLIVKKIGKPCAKHQQIMLKNSHLRALIRPAHTKQNSLQKTFSNWSTPALDLLISCLKMDPQIRPPAEDLLKHNFFLQDRFPQSFLPALRERVLLEYNSNPLLRRFKAEILTSTDRKDYRRASQIDPPRWKISLADASVRRKFSCDSNDSMFSDRNAALTISNQKLDVVQKSSQQDIGKQKDRDTQQSFYNSKLSQSNFDSSKSTQLQILEKSLESLSMLSQKIGSRASSVHKIETVASQPSSPPQFHSLQPISPVEVEKTQQNVLHPNISNISFGMKPPKKSPNILQSINSVSFKATFNQVPLLHPYRGQFLKKLDTFSTDPSNIVPLWNNTLAASQRKKDFKARTDDFILPNVPGATSSPQKNKRKDLQGNPDILAHNPVTPLQRLHSATSQKSSSSKLSNGFSFL